MAGFGSALVATLAPMGLWAGLWGVPALMLLLAWHARRSPADAQRPWRLALAGSLAMVLLALAGGAVVWVTGPQVLGPLPYWPALRVDTLGMTLLALSGLLGWVILRFASRYLEGDEGRSRLLSGLAGTLALVWWLATLESLLWVALVWSLSSFGVFGLLRFYRDRPAARLAAHKQFVVNRVADGLMGVALLLLYQALGTLEFGAMATRLGQLDGATPALKAAALCLVLVAVLRCALMPFHGWLLQVMEAPTPVSALLHAGVVNLGGFVLLRLTDLLLLVPAAQAVLVVLGGLSAALAALAMLTRVSIKLALAWSTTAQMGLMLLQIGLGAWNLALLHLLAHALYKANAFLLAGSRAREPGLPAARNAVTVRVWLVGALVSLALVGGGTLAAVGLGGASQLPVASVVALAWLAAGMVPALALASTGSRGQTVCLVGGLMLVLGGLHVAAHWVLSPVLPAAAGHIPGALVGIAFTTLALLFLAQVLVLAQPQSALARWLHPHAFAGFHLDEWVTRALLRVWPVTLPRRQVRHHGFDWPRPSLRSSS